jgi:hypothetical protein
LRSARDFGPGSHAASSTPTLSSAQTTITATTGPMTARRGPEPAGLGC